MESLRRVEAMDFEILVSGHGRVGKHRDIKPFCGYMTDLYDAVFAGSHVGLTVDKMKSSIELSKHAKLFMYDKWTPLNIEGKAQHISMQRIAR